MKHYPLGRFKNRHPSRFIQLASKILKKSMKTGHKLSTGFNKNHVFQWIPPHVRLEGTRWQANLQQRHCNGYHSSLLLMDKKVIILQLISLLQMVVMVIVIVGGRSVVVAALAVGAAATVPTTTTTAAFCNCLH